MQIKPAALYVLIALAGAGAFALVDGFFFRTSIAPTDYGVWRVNGFGQVSYCTFKSPQKFDEAKATCTAWGASGPDTPREVKRQPESNPFLDLIPEKKEGEAEAPPSRSKQP